VKADIVERLESVLAELQRLPLLAGRDGSALLDTLEATERVRQMIRTRAKARLSKEPDALPGWMIALPNGQRSSNPGPRWKEGRTLVQEHRRSTSIKLIRRRSLQKTLKEEGKETTP
jgi:hypothetical protein